MPVEMDDGLLPTPGCTHEPLHLQKVRFEPLNAARARIKAKTNAEVVGGGRNDKANYDRNLLLFARGQNSGSTDDSMKYAHAFANLRMVPRNSDNAMERTAM
jgi:hypothetical protein